MIAIVNASPLIYLAQLGSLDLLHQLYDQVITTPEVQKEVLQPQFSEYLVLDLAFKDWLIVTPCDNQTVIEKLLHGDSIHLGEASVIALALNYPGSTSLTLVIDDAVAKSIARTLNIKTLSTIGIILEAFKAKINTREQTKLLLDRLAKTTKFRFSVKLYTQILEELDGPDL